MPSVVSAVLSTAAAAAGAVRFGRAAEAARGEDPPGEEFVVDEVRRRLCLFEDLSPVEQVLGHSLAALVQDELWDRYRPGPLQEEGGREVSVYRRWLHSPQHQRAGELNSAAIAASGVVDANLYQYVDSMRRHCWRWVMDRPLVRGALVTPFLVTMLRKHFQDWLDRFEWDLVLMKAVLDDAEELGPELPVNFTSTAPSSSGGEFDQLLVLKLRRDRLKSNLAAMQSVIDRKVFGDERGLDLFVKQAVGVETAREHRREMLDELQRIVDAIDGIRAASDTGGALKAELQMPALEMAGLQVRQSRGLAFSRGELRRGRKRINKACKLFEKLGYGSLLSSFANGKRVVLLCKTGLELRVQVLQGRRGIMAQSCETDHWTVPFKLEVVWQGALMGKLCVYARDTPVLDFLLALILHVESGSERELLRAGNWYGVHNATLALQLLDRLYGLRPAQLERQAGAEWGEHEGWHDYRGAGFRLDAWVEHPAVRKARAGELWPVDLKGWLSQPLPARKPGRLLDEDFSDVAWYNAARLDSVGPKIDDAIAIWMATALGRWAEIRDGMEEIYRGYDLWETPHGWNEPYAKAFSSVVSGSQDFPEELEPPPRRREAEAAETEDLVLGLDATQH